MIKNKLKLNRNTFFVALLTLLFIGIGWLTLLGVAKYKLFHLEPDLKNKDRGEVENRKKLPESTANSIPIQANNFYMALGVASVHQKPSGNSERVTQALHGEPVRVLSRQGSWVEVSLPEQFDYHGWMQESALKAIPTGDWLNLKIISVASVEVRTLPGGNAPLVEVLSLGTVVASEPSKTNEDFTFVKLVDGRNGYVVSTSLLDYSQKKAPQVSSDRILETARQLLGQPYLWGGMTTTGVDCSGFVYTVFKVHGIRLHRDADLQYFYDGFRVTPEELRPGDLVFFETYKSGPSHIGIYVGDKQFIQASSGGVKYGSLDSKYFSTHFIGAKRILGSK